MRYREAGVDIGGGDALKRGIVEAVRATWTPAVRPLPGGFAGVMEWPGEPGAPLLAATMDGVGTKLHLAIQAGRVAEAAADLVYHCANDLLAHGARPLAFLDYIAQTRLERGLIEAAVEGLSRACSEVGAALLGGETAEMPDTYLPGVVDVAGCMVGVVAPERLLGPEAVRCGDVLLGLASNGLHTNGFSLARRVLASSGLAISDRLPGGQGESVGDALLRPHRWYGPALASPLEAGRVRALAHVTGGGIAGNLVRVLPPGARARVKPDAWPRPAVFRWLAEAGRIPEADLRRTFNLGVGMIAVCPADGVGGLKADLERGGERAWRIGEITAGERGVEWEEAG